MKELIRHLLFVKFKEGVLQGDIVRARSEFSEIQNKIEGLSGFEWGENTSPEGFSEEFTHCIQLIFANEEARDRYIPHPDHEKLKNTLLPILEKIIVIDYLI